MGNKNSTDGNSVQLAQIIQSTKSINNKKDYTILKECILLIIEHLNMLSKDGKTYNQLNINNISIQDNKIIINETITTCKYGFGWMRTTLPDICLFLNSDFFPVTPAILLIELLFQIDKYYNICIYIDSKIPYTANILDVKEIEIGKIDWTTESHKSISTRAADILPTDDVSTSRYVPKNVYYSPVDNKQLFDSIPKVFLRKIGKILKRKNRCNSYDLTNCSIIPLLTYFLCGNRSIEKNITINNSSSKTQYIIIGKEDTGSSKQPIYLLQNVDTKEEYIGKPNIRNNNVPKLMRDLKQLDFYYSLGNYIHINDISTDIHVTIFEKLTHLREIDFTVATTYNRLIENILSAIKKLHINSYIHNDIKPQNIMMKKDGTFVLIDYDDLNHLYDRDCVIRYLSTSLYTSINPGMMDSGFNIHSPLHSPLHDLVEFGYTLNYLFGNKNARRRGTSNKINEYLTFVCCYPNDLNEYYKNIDEIFSIAKNLLI